MTRFFYVTIFLVTYFFSKNSIAQFSGPVDSIGTTAIYKDSSIFIDWANRCKIIRGFQDISTPSLGTTLVGDSTSAIGKAGENAVVSLGDGGVAILQFKSPISDGSGNDFAVFENSFSNFYLELAYVEVSSDGIHYFRFPATSNTETTIQVGPFDYLDPTKLNNLAGKYRALYGTPFDLADITNHAQLDKNSITHVKIIDVVGSIQNQYSSTDINSHQINDPWPTPYGSGGFDLDAIGVIHNQSNTANINEIEFQIINLYPNPVADFLKIIVETSNPYSIYITNILGETNLELHQLSHATAINTNDLKQGIYSIKITIGNTSKTLKFIKL